MSQPGAVLPPLVLAVLTDINPSSVMDVVKPLLTLARRQVIRLRVVLEPYFTPKDLQQVALVVFCRNLEPRYQHILALVQARRLPIIYDLDDDLFAVPEDSSLGAYYAQPQRRAQLEHYLRSAWLVRVYAPLLLARVQPYNPNVQVVLPPLDWPLMQRWLPQRRPDELKIVYATSRREDHLFPIFEPALHAVHRRYSPRLQLYFWGCRPESFVGLPGVHFLPFEADYDRYLKNFARMGFDIGLAPLLDDRFHLSKTDNKFREYAACAISGVYSDVAVYRAGVEHERTGLLVENTPAAWEAALVRLLDDPAACRRMGEAARQTVMQRYDPEAFIAVWQAQIETTLAASQPPEVNAAVALPAPAATAAPASTEAPVATDNASGLLRRVYAWLSRGGPRHWWRTGLIHLRNYWRLFKINRWKRL